MFDDAHTALFWKAAKMRFKLFFHFIHLQCRVSRKLSFSHWTNTFNPSFAFDSLVMMMCELQKSKVHFRNNLLTFLLGIILNDSWPARLPCKYHRLTLFWFCTCVQESKYRVIRKLRIHAIFFQSFRHYNNSFISTVRTTTTMNVI